MSNKRKITSNPVNFSDIKDAVHGKTKKSKRSRRMDNHHQVPRSISKEKCPIDSDVCNKLYKDMGYPDNYRCRDDTGDKDCKINYNGNVGTVVSGGTYNMYLPVDKQYVLWDDGDNVFYWIPGVPYIDYNDLSSNAGAAELLLVTAYDAIATVWNVSQLPKVLRLSGKGENKSWPFLIEKVGGSDGENIRWGDKVRIIVQVGDTKSYVRIPSPGGSKAKLTWDKKDDKNVWRILPWCNKCANIRNSNFVNTGDDLSFYSNTNKEWGLYRENSKYVNGDHTGDNVGQKDNRVNQYDTRFRLLDSNINVEGV